MRKLTLIYFFTFLTLFGFAQHCSVDSFNITPSPDSMATLSPLSADMPCMSMSQIVSDTIYLTNYSRISGFHVQSITIDSIGNLPAGLCWASNKTGNTFAGGEHGAICIQGLVYALPGQYKLAIYVHGVTDAFSIPISNAQAAFGLNYYLRVICPGSACPDIDTVNGQSNYFVGYTNQLCRVGINDINDDLSHISISPNPLSTTIHLSFSADIDAVYTLRMVNIYGAVVSSQTINATVGQNEYTLQRADLSAGIYMLTLSDSKTTVTRKVLIN